ncbi:hypothetical protein EJB05_54680, partial [Eragrostis curvula]
MEPPGPDLVEPSASPPPSSPGPGLVGPAASPPPRAADLVLVPPSPAPPQRHAPAPCWVKSRAPPQRRPPTPCLVKSPAPPQRRPPGPCLVPSPATQPGCALVRREPSSQATRGPGWLVLDRFVHRTSRRHGVVEGDATTSEISDDCVGRPIRVSLRVADPPALSRLYLHWTGRPAIKKMMEPNVVTAHRNSILFKVTVPFEDPETWHYASCFPVDYFVYSAAASSPPSLIRLPPCFEGGAVNPQVDEMFRPYRNQRQRTMMDQDMGLLCHGNDDGEFTVADLGHRYWEDVELCVLHHKPLSGSRDDDMEWRVKKLPIPSGLNKKLRSFWSDTVVAVDERHLCWVDYYQGLLLIDVLTESPQLQYIPLPAEALQSRRPYIDALSPDPFRCVSVIHTGIIKLVCVIAHSRSAFTIKTWAFDFCRGQWKDCHGAMDSNEFFGLYGPAQSNLPQVKPCFPVVSLINPHIICFLLKEEDQHTIWMIAVDMKKKVLKSSALYINEEEEEGYSSQRDIRYIFRGDDFIPSRFSSYLRKDGITR